ncbi:MAG: hypothetical protein ABFD79_02995 [Phycisphaerales bacterium]
MISDKLFHDEDRKYSLNRIIRLMSGFPEDKPLPCRYEHGHTPYNDEPVNDLRSKKRLMLVYNKRRLDNWRRYSKKPVYIIGSPFVQYRRMMNITTVDNRCGTVAYPMHSTLKEEGVFDREEYCTMLKRLPANFHPIKLCIHEHDFQLGFDKIYRQNGFEIVTAGVREEPDFVDKFYEILRQCKYTTSNYFGSYLFYSVEMGIPFFIYGPQTATIRYKYKQNVLEKIIEAGEYFDYIVKLFSTYPEVGITEEQKKAVEQEIGINDAIEGKELYNLLMANYTKQCLQDALWFPFRHPRKFVQRIFAFNQQAK